MSNNNYLKLANEMNKMFQEQFEPRYSNQKNKIITSEESGCPYCGNTSGKTDHRGNCVSCGGDLGKLVNKKNKPYKNAFMVSVSDCAIYTYNGKIAITGKSLISTSLEVSFSKENAFGYIYSSSSEKITIVDSVPLINFEHTVNTELMKINSQIASMGEDTNIIGEIEVVYPKFRFKKLNGGMIEGYPLETNIGNINNIYGYYRIELQ